MKFQYRAVLADGVMGSGLIDAADRPAAVAALRVKGARPIEVKPVALKAATSPARPASAASRQAAIALTGELSVLLNAGLPLDRALALAIGNVADAGAARAFEEMLSEVREGSPLSRTMATRPASFSPASAAMAEAGEANGRLGAALARLAAMLEGAEDLRKTITAAMVYPALLAVVATGVILLMLLFVVPQFESLFASGGAELPAASRYVMSASRLVREQGLLILGLVVAAGFVVRQLLATPSARATIDALVLRVPQLGALIRAIEAARFARTLGALVDGNIALPQALALARRTINNSVIGDAIASVANGMREGGGLARPLAETGALPRMAIGFLTTGEETSQLGPMLDRLADVLDRDVKRRLQRLIAILTPAITIFLGAAVAGIVAAIMSAIMGFNELAITQ